jgi:hypothetical protein
VTTHNYVFPSCENEVIDATKAQKTWRTAWRSLVRTTARQAGRKAARATLEAKWGLSSAKAAWRHAAASFSGLRFHDLRHQWRWQAT